ncbi:MAG: Zn-ribbon domain-containing OB-fold protein [Betaproteobacteria bacterium]
MTRPEAGAAARFELPVCEECGTVQYPVREVCVQCLSDRVPRRPVEPGGMLLACTRLHRSMDERYAPRLPLAIASVKLDAGPIAIVLLQSECKIGTRVRIRLTAGPVGKTILSAVAED